MDNQDNDDFKVRMTQRDVENWRRRAMESDEDFNDNISDEEREKYRREIDEFKKSIREGNDSFRKRVVEGSKGFIQSIQDSIFKVQQNIVKLSDVDFQKYLGIRALKSISGKFSGVTGVI